MPRPPARLPYLMNGRTGRRGPWPPNAASAFRAALPDDAARRRELGVLARAGFPQSLAVRALGLDRTEAEAMCRRLRQE